MATCAASLVSETDASRPAADGQCAPTLSSSASTPAPSQGEIHRFDPASQAHSKESYGKPIGNIQLRQNKPGVRAVSLGDGWRSPSVRDRARS